ncbi:hypothetical protein FQ087_07490 [Sporosarcina sp. ANT_H38]|uniref:hypothetical protein n=1 Tax=Sporosarcina sp. ANT_H38 TaxID=2597358 RepID=UPI0011F301BD|nr:hypothetical protein [Sporosarcina sp. ANT_H38]KAA0966082.1 hypothetical protein FQ087_07490 [Sporosarcina sp. ANT_H38]
MNPQRKRMIISEIKYWKQNKLLPEHYCDFLITLYAQGEEEEEVKAIEAILVKEKKKLKRTVIMLSILAIIVSGGMFVFIQYPGLTLVLTAAVSLSFLLLTLRKSTSQMGVAPFLYILASFMLLLMSLKLWDVFFEGHTMLLIGLLILNCALWLFAGRMLKLQYFSISGAAGLLLITGFLLVSF